MATAKQKTSTARVTKLREEGTEERAARTPDKHVGETLREARETRGMTVDMVADELMIRRFYLEALEAGSFRDLPERVYATGFVRSYATYMGLDVAQVVDQFRRDAYGTRSSTYQVELVMPEPVVHSVIPGRTVIISTICAVLMIIGGVIFATRTKTAAVTNIPAPPAEASTATDITPPEMNSSAAADVMPTTTAAATSVASDATATGFDLPAPPSAAPAAATATTTTTATTDTNVSAGLPAATAAASLPGTAAKASAAAAVPTTRLAVEALESSWVEVKDGKGAVLFTSILKKGQLLPIPDQKGITLTTGNAGGLRILLDGQAQPPLGQTNEVKRNFALDADKLAKR